MTQRTFHADAMALYSWAADEHGRLTFLSPSLVEFLEAIGEIRDRDSVELRQDGTLVLQRADEPVVSTAFDLLDWLFPMYGDIVKEVGALFRADGETEDFDQKLDGARVIRRSSDWRRVIDSSGNRADSLRTVSVRVVHPDGLGIGPQVRLPYLFDLIALKRFRRSGDGSDKCTGFQGQILDAWPRVHPVMVNAVRTATLRLMARSLSHNIGSHALHHVIDDLKAAETAAGPSLGGATARDHRVMYEYLRDRFEMLASVSVESPMPWMRASIQEILSSFRPHDGNVLLWKNICRSENSVAIGAKAPRYLNSDGLIRDSGVEQVGLPGGFVARHAFLIMIENIVRDCAKHQRTGAESDSSLDLKVFARPDPRFNGFIKVDVGAARVPPKDRPAGVEPANLDGVADAVASLRKKSLEQLCASDGLPAHWGVQERLVCACLMRGRKPEDFLPLAEVGSSSPQRSGSPPGACHPWGLVAPAGEPPLVEIGDDVVGIPELKGRVVWTFWMPEPRRPVMIVPRNRAVLRDGHFEQIQFDPAGPSFRRSDLPIGSTELFVATGALPSACRIDWNDLPGIVGIGGNHEGNSSRAAPSWVVTCDEPRDRADLLEKVARARFPGLQPLDIEPLYAGDPVPGLSNNWPEQSEQTVLPVRHGKRATLTQNPKMHEVAERMLEDFKMPNGPADGWRWKRHPEYEEHRFEGHVEGDSLREYLAMGKKDPGEMRWELSLAMRERFLVVDERIGAVKRDGNLRLLATGIDEQLRDNPFVSVRQMWALAGVDVAMVVASGNDKSIFESLLSELRADRDRKPPYRGVFVHYGLLEKFAKLGVSGLASPRAVLQKVLATASDGTTVVVHSGRNFPKELVQTLHAGGRVETLCKFCSIGNLVALLMDQKRCKLDLYRFFNSL